MLSKPIPNNCLSDLHKDRSPFRIMFKILLFGLNCLNCYPVQYRAIKNVLNHSIAYYLPWNVLFLNKTCFIHSVVN